MGVGLILQRIMGAGASVQRSPSFLKAEIDKLRERELNTKVKKHGDYPFIMAA